MKIKTKLKRIGFVIAALLLFLFFLVQNTIFVKAHADTTIATNSITSESNILDDLKCFQSDDATLNVNDYIAIDDDYVFELIMIAEGSKGELFVYIYQPCYRVKNYLTEQIAIATMFNEDDVDNTLNYRLYSLNLINSSESLFKYQVDDFFVLENECRLYNISAIYRTYDSDVDGDVYDGQEINLKGQRVGYVYEVKTVDGKAVYHLSLIETIEITNMIVGKMRYVDGYGLVHKYCDSHFVAFRTNKPIDSLMEADVSYVWEKGYRYYDDGEDEWENESGPERAYLPVKSDETGENSGDKGLFGKKYEWSRIHKPDQFINDENLTINNNRTKNDLLNMHWVLRFTETEYDNSYVAQFSYETRISEVTVLRLKFVTEGCIYNLGVVADIQTGPKEPIGSADSQFDDFMKEIEQMFKDLENGLQGVFEGIGAVVITIVCIVAGCALLSIIPGVGSIFGIVFGAIFKIIGWILRLLLWFIVFPFNLIGKLFKRNKKNE